MRKTLFLLLIISSFSYGQTKYDNFDELISEANKLRTDAIYEQAILKYKDALDILTPNSSTPFFNLAECALKLNNNVLADKWIRKGIAEGGAQMEYLRKYKGFSEIQNEEFYQKIIEDYNSLRQQYFSTIDNIDIYLEIEELTARDQFVRKIDDYISGRTDEDISNAMEQLKIAQKENDSVNIKKYMNLIFPKPNKEYKKLQNELMRKVDSLNIQRLMEITKEHGWQERAWIILWHQRGNHDEDNYVWNYFRPLINKEIEDGKISRNFWSAFDQFKEMIKNGNFGTITVGEKPKNEIKNENKKKIKG
ncbi:hypothetical protein [Flavobacterium sp. ASW18X]|uniref:hypothetical protein n=1 Tax=Flavobacterium sp. ASW18X TaxID=2572595 RepID=UPI0010AE6CDB|nr:hypothetical protein [Flavobacterium sp. ASW18X]TKD54570.1 hypothetical protein FBT53_15895 [Flavobacterium sp. ASW18X]